jgi:hypothetical protein
MLKLFFHLQKENTRDFGNYQENNNGHLIYLKMQNGVKEAH